MVSEVTAIARNWWLFVVLGVVCLITGILAIVWPSETLLVLAILAGIYLMVVAFLEILEAIAGEPDGRALSAILGVLALIAGLIVIRRPGESLVAVVVVLGVFLVAAGVIRIVRAFGAPVGRGWAIGLGAIDLIIGIVILAWPKIGLVTLAVFFALTMLVRGVFSVYVGLQLRRLRDTEPPAVRTAPA